MKKIFEDEFMNIQIRMICLQQMVESLKDFP